LCLQKIKGTLPFIQLSECEELVGGYSQEM